MAGFSIWDIQASRGKGLMSRVAEGSDAHSPKKSRSIEEERANGNVPFNCCNLIWQANDYLAGVSIEQKRHAELAAPEGRSKIRLLLAPSFHDFTLLHQHPSAFPQTRTIVCLS